MRTGTDVILVMGATGKQGGALARELLARGHKVRALTRKPQAEAAQALATLGATIVQADFDDPASMERALEGVWGVFAVQNTWEAGVEREEAQGKRIAQLAKKAGLQHFVYTSVSSAQHNTGIPHFDNKWRIEETVCSLGFPSYTIIRPAFFMENFLLPSFKAGFEEGQLLIGIKPDTVLQMIAVKDIGKYHLLAFERHEELNGRAVDIAGDAHTMVETARILGRAMAKTITHVQVPIEEVRKWSEDYGIMLEWFDRVGYSVDIPTLEKTHGIRPTKLEEWATAVRWR